jgi:hypothetical protein
VLEHLAPRFEAGEGPGGEGVRDVDARGHDSMAYQDVTCNAEIRQVLASARFQALEALECLKSSAVWEIVREVGPIIKSLQTSTFMQSGRLLLWRVVARRATAKALQISRLWS